MAGEKRKAIKDPRWCAVPARGHAHQGLDLHAQSPAPLQSLYSLRPGAQGRVCAFPGPHLPGRCGEGPAPPVDLRPAKPFSACRAFLGPLKTYFDNTPPFWRA
jgi:hypothetical protein